MQQQPGGHAGPSGAPAHEVILLAGNLEESIEAQQASKVQASHYDLRVSRQKYLFQTISSLDEHCCQENRQMVWSIKNSVFVCYKYFAITLLDIRDFYCIFPDFFKNSFTSALPDLIARDLSNPGSKGWPSRLIVLASDLGRLESSEVCLIPVFSLFADGHEAGKSLGGATPSRGVTK